MCLPFVARGRTFRGGCAAKPQAHFGIMEKPLSHVIPAFLSLNIWSQREGRLKLETHLSSVGVRGLESAHFLELLLFKTSRDETVDFVLKSITIFRE